MEGPRGTLTKSFKHIDLELTKVGKNRIRVDIWFATRKQMACLRTICSHIENLFKGVLYVSGVPVHIPTLSIKMRFYSIGLTSPLLSPPFSLCI